ncbi:MAG: TRM11 family SAM-dependent methyltransferase [Actinomycetota bacterium]
MSRYALLLKASANRVYGASAFDLARAELLAMARASGALVEHIDREEIAGVDYLVATSTSPLTERQVELWSNLSSLHALFEVEGARFAPVSIAPLARLDEDIVTIQRYPGKTNEAFTHLLVNMALVESDDAFGRLLRGGRLTLVDPVCGRGTTLNRAALYGMDACGIELDQRDAEAYTQFLLTWLKDKRLKHRLEQAKLRRGRDTPAHRITVTYGHGKDRSTHRVIDVIHDDTRAARTHLKARSADLMACDLPYGVQHGSSRGSEHRDRGPAGLLAEALPVWFELLQPGAAVALAWNLNTLKRPRLVQLLREAGFELRSAEDDDSFVHRVDRAIRRDVLVAARPAG